MPSSQPVVDNHAGVPNSSTGRRSRIEQSTVWKLVGATGACHGQVIAFDRWEGLG